MMTQFLNRGISIFTPDLFFKTKLALNAALNARRSTASGVEALLFSAARNGNGE